MTGSDLQLETCDLQPTQCFARLFAVKFKYRKIITNIPGSIAMLRSVSCGPSVEIERPMIGSTIDVATIPAPPRIDNPNAPLFGMYSATNPNIVGQK